MWVLRSTIILLNSKPEAFWGMTFWRGRPKASSMLSLSGFGGTSQSKAWNKEPRLLFNNLRLLISSPNVPRMSIRWRCWTCRFLLWMNSAKQRMYGVKMNRLMLFFKQYLYTSKVFRAAKRSHSRSTLENWVKNINYLRKLS